MMRRALVFMLLAVTAVAAPAAAHQPVAPPVVEFVAAELLEVISAVPAPDGPPWLVLLVAGAASFGIVRRPRRSLALALAIVVAALAFETGLHSTHHLGQDSSSCSVASIAPQLSGTVDETTVDAVPYFPARTTTILPGSPLASCGSVSPDAGRAPPVTSA